MASAKRAALEQELRQRALELRAHQTRCAEEQRAARQRVDYEAVTARHEHEEVTRVFAELQRRDKVEQQARNARGYAEQRVGVLHHPQYYIESNWQLATTV